ncbi:MAG: aldo/keto reductase [Clostridia bacterium]|nr:aldo/keto reductase [Clostridia bacterium]
MEFAMLEKIGAKPSRLGFGCMRFPLNDQGGIDEPRAEAMLDRAYKAGVNYFDTAYFYHNRTSEKFVGRALKKYPRESFYLATKLPLSMIHSLDEAKEIYEGQFRTLQVEYFDFYLLHCVNAGYWKMVKETGILDYLIEQQKLGRIHRLGFSFHDSYEVFEEVATYRDWDFCQIQLNYMDIDIQAGMKGYELCCERGIPVIVMEPVKGGSLATLSEEITAMFRKARPDMSVASWAMRWVGSLDNCAVILSGMSNEEQVEDNLATFTHFEPLSEAEMKVVDEVREAIRARTFVACTDCKYCMPCPFGVNIPGNFRMMNDYAKYSNAASLKARWNDMKEEERASACKSCGKCETACPQQLPIREKLHAIAQKMAE